MYNVSCIVMSKKNRNFPLFFILCDKKGMIIAWGIISLYSKKRVFNPELFARNSFFIFQIFSSAVAELSEKFLDSHFVQETGGRDIPGV